MQIDILPDAVNAAICEGALETQQMRWVRALKNIPCLSRCKFSQFFVALKACPEISKARSVPEARCALKLTSNAKCVT